MNLETRIAGITLKNPVIKASGVNDSNALQIKEIENRGFAAAVYKSTKAKGSAGNAEPTLHEFSKDCLLNRKGLPNAGAVNTVAELNKATYNIPIFGSVAGSSIKEYFYVAAVLEYAPSIKVNILNLSCTNTGNDVICYDLKFTKNLFKYLEGVLSKPYLVKLAPYNDFVKLRKTIDIIAASEAKGIVLTNTKPVRIEPDPWKRIAYNWGQSGPSIHGSSVRDIQEAYVYIQNNKLDLDLIGCGGVRNGDDVLRFIHAGAKAVAMVTSLQRGYPYDIINLINNGKKGIIPYMKHWNCKSIEEFRGITAYQKTARKVI